MKCFLTVLAAGAIMAAAGKVGADQNPFFSISNQAAAGRNMIAVGSPAQRFDGAAELEPAAEPKSTGADEQAPAQEDGWLTRRQKVVLLNVGAVGGVLAYGFLNWDYGKESLTIDNEGWFGRTTDEGGMDKLGHFWSAYAFSHLLAAVYEHWDYNSREANLYGALSSFGIQAAMEVADAFSGHGFSGEDFVMNTVGAGTGYLWGRYPWLKEKIDFRMEYTPRFDSDDVEPFTNYEAQRYLLAVKADGFEAVTNPWLQYLELHVGYFARNYEDYNRRAEDNRRRTVYLGIGINISKVVKDTFGIGIFDYLQIPYTSLRLEYDVD